MAALSPRTSPTELPDRDLTADDVRKVRFAMALRGYRMSDVDWALEKMADELDRLRAEVAELSARETGAPVLAGVGSTVPAQGEWPVASRTPETVIGDAHRPDPSATGPAGDR
jgi:DivIVA domain-containing protein